MTRPSPGGVFRAAVAFVLTAAVLWKSDPSAIGRALAGTRPGPLALAALLVVADRALMAYRWLVLVRPFSGPRGPGVGAVMRIFLVSTFMGTFLPATVGGDAVRAFALARQGVATPSAVASVVMDRILGMVSILMMAVAGLAFARRMAFDPLVQTALGVTIAACAAATAVVFSSALERGVRRVLERLPWARARSGGVRLVEAMQAYAARRGDLVNVLCGSVAVQVLRIAQAYCLGLALGMTQPFTVYLALIPLNLLVMLVPVTVNGLGTSQAAFVWTFGQVGVPDPVAFSLSVLFLALGVLGNLPGGLLYAVGGIDGPRRADDGNSGR